MAPHQDVGSVSEWLAGLKTRDDRAVEQIWQRYYDQLVRLAQKNLGALPHQEGAEDVALSAFKSFCLRAQQGKFPQLQDRDDLWKLLITITLRKAWRQRKREAKHVLNAGADFLAEELAGEGPTPEMAAMVTDEFRRLFGLLNDPVVSAVVMMKLEGHTNQQVADIMEVSVATVERKLQLARKAWSAELPD